MYDKFKNSISTWTSINKIDVQIWVQIFGKSYSLIAHFHPLLKCLWRFCALDSHLQLTPTAPALYGLFKLAWRSFPDKIWSSHTVFLPVLPYLEVRKKKKKFYGRNLSTFHIEGGKTIFCPLLIKECLPYSLLAGAWEQSSPKTDTSHFSELCACGFMCMY